MHILNKYISEKRKTVTGSYLLINLSADGVV